MWMDGDLAVHCGAICGAVVSSTPGQTSKTGTNVWLSYSLHLGKELPFVLFFFFFFLPYRATPMANGGSQARGWIGAAAAGLRHSIATRGLSHVCDLHHSSWQCQILNLLSETRDRTRILMDTSQLHFHCTAVELPHLSFDHSGPAAVCSATCFIALPDF